MDLQTSAQSRVTLQCQQCGHEWKGRSSAGTARQCSKCRSRQIVEIANGPDAASLIVPVDKTPSSMKTDNPHTMDFKGYLEDPEVQAKIKELQLARLERQIAEVKGVSLNGEVVGRIVAQQKAIIRALSDGKSNDIGYLEAECPWCGNGEMCYEEIREDTWGWKCHKCGRLAG